MMEQEGGTKLASIETGDTFQNALPNDIISVCDEKNDWWYKTVSDYWAGSVERGTPFLVTFTGKTSNEKEYFEQALRRHFEQIDSFPRAKADFSSNYTLTSAKHTNQMKRDNVLNQRPCYMLNTINVYSFLEWTLSLIM
eukprot:678424_1